MAENELTQASKDINIFSMYCANILRCAGSAPGRYSKEDLREQVLRMPHAVLVGIKNDRMIEEYRIVPDDVAIDVWVREKVLPMKGWEPEPFWMMGDRIGTIKGWTDWQVLDAYFMPLGLEPGIFVHNRRYILNQKAYLMCEFRFLPLKSFTYDG